MRFLLAALSFHLSLLKALRFSSLNINILFQTKLKLLEKKRLNFIPILKKDFVIKVYEKLIDRKII